MAVAAYASVLSLLRVVDNMQHPSHLRLFPDPTQIDALREKLCFLQEFLEVHSSAITEADIESIVRKIPRIAYDAEISIDKYVVDRLCGEDEDLQNDAVSYSVESFRDEMHQLIQKIEPINEALLKTLRTDRERRSRVRDRPKNVNNDRPLTSSGEMVGFDNQSKQVLEKLTGNQTNLVIVPIVGMGGIGKTTLTRSVFDHPYNLERFSVRIWLTISQDYSVRKVLRGLLSDGVVVLSGMGDSGIGDESEAELIKQLHQKLFGQRYLIVLDDVWSLEAWHDLRRGFPDNGKGSRVLVTTRLSSIASSLGPQHNSYSMKLLDEDKSWDLFNKKAFRQGGWSLELENIGREISRRCNGLPLMLVLIGGLLANSDMTAQYWRAVAENVSSVANSANDEYCLSIVSLSYHHLPIHLKPCFLYMRHFAEDSNVDASGLIHEWVAGGFVKPTSGKSLEESAREYLEDLTGRNMFLIREMGRNGDIKVCAIHDLLRDLSIKESNREEFLELNKTVSVTENDTNMACVVCNDEEKDLTTLFSKFRGSTSDGKMLMCSSCEGAFPEFARSRFVAAVKFEYQNAPLLTTYRYIKIYPIFEASVFHTIRLIWNLEILIIESEGIALPKEIWEMPQLRHVTAFSFTLHAPENDVLVLENLQTFTAVSQLKFTEEIARRIPNVRTLGVTYNGHDFLRDEGEDWQSVYLQHIAHLQKLEHLTVTCFMVSITDIKKVNGFPCSLKELTLDWCKIISWDDMTIIGSLPNLQALNLRNDAVLGVEWNPSEGEFLKLKRLELSGLNLAHWAVDEAAYFPALETLVLSRMDYLEGIPREFGELCSLKSISLRMCPNRINDSARAIVEEQLINGNEELVVHVMEKSWRSYEICGANIVSAKQ